MSNEELELIRQYWLLTDDNRKIVKAIQQLHVSIPDAMKIFNSGKYKYFPNGTIKLLNKELDVKTI